MCSKTFQIEINICYLWHEIDTQTNIPQTKPNTKLHTLCEAQTKVFLVSWKFNLILFAFWFYGFANKIFN